MEERREMWEIELMVLINNWMTRTRAEKKKGGPSVLTQRLKKRGAIDTSWDLTSHPFPSCPPPPWGLSSEPCVTSTELTHSQRKVRSTGVLTG